MISSGDLEPQAELSLSGLVGADERVICMALVLRGEFEVLDWRLKVPFGLVAAHLRRAWFRKLTSRLTALIYRLANTEHTARASRQRLDRLGVVIQQQLRPCPRYDR